jgi:ubiquinone/menaquinone biosynthesis C-methylase UbiE
MCGRSRASTGRVTGEAKDPIYENALEKQMKLPNSPDGFAHNRATADYYEQRAREYDDWYTGAGLFASRDRPGWDVAVADLESLVASLPVARTLDVACGTGFLTRHLRGLVVALDQSPSMAAITQTRIQSNIAMVGDALDLPFPNNSFERVFTGHFYGHLPFTERRAFLSEVVRVAAELIVIDAARRPNIEPELWQERVLRDGSRHRVFKRYFTSDQLRDELGGEILLENEWFVAVRTATADSLVNSEGKTAESE